MKLPIVLIPVLTAVTLAAQTPAPAQNSSGQHHSSARRDMLQRWTARLNLTSDQQNQAKAIFQNSRNESRSLAAKLHEERATLNAAVKNDSEQQIDQITQQDSKLHAQMEAIHLKAMAKFYAILTPEQKTKFDAWSNHRAS